MQIDNFIYKLSEINVCLTPKTESLMWECKLKYRDGKNHTDILKILNKKRQPCISHGIMPWINIEWYGIPKTYSDIHDEIADEMDKVVRIDWNAYYGKMLPSLLFV